MREREREREVGVSNCYDHMTFTEKTRMDKEKRVHVVAADAAATVVAVEDAVFYSTLIFSTRLSFPPTFSHKRLAFFQLLFSVSER